jgi:hypothetical protein
VSSSRAVVRGLVAALADSGWSGADLAKLAGGHILRALGAAEEVAGG